MTSIRLKLTLGAALLFAAGIGLLVAANAFFLEPYYAELARRDFASIAGEMARGQPGLAEELGLARRLAAGLGYKIVVADAEGVVTVSSVPEFEEGQRFPLPKDQLDSFLARRDALMRGDSFFGILDASPRGQAVIQLLAPLREGRFLVVSQPLEQLRRSIRAASPFFLVVGGLVLALVFAVVLAYSGRMTRPVLALAGVARRVAGGELGARAGLRRDDELGLLGASLDAMSDSLAGSIRELAEANRELAREAEARDAFVAGAAHELKTPVGLVRGYAEAIKLGLYSGEAERAELAGVILDEADRLARLVRDLAEISALKAGAERSLRLREEDLAALAARSAARFSLPARERGLSLALEAEGPLAASCDGDRVLQALDNLLSNALRHAPAPSEVLLRLRRESGRAILEVENEGDPIPEEALGSLFEPFSRVDPSRSRASGGTGLGLAVVRGIAEAHGGSCGLSNLERGVRFWIELPIGREGPRESS